MTNVTASTTGANGSVLATDRGGGYIYVYGGSYTSGGRDSAGVYSTGVIDAKDATITSVGGEPLIIEGGNSAALTNCVLTGAKGSKDRGIFLYQSMVCQFGTDLPEFSESVHLLCYREDNTSISHCDLLLKWRRCI